jgi:hypothetical protein
VSDASTAWLALYSLWYAGEAGRYQLPAADSLPPEFRPWTPEDSTDRLANLTSLSAPFFRQLAVAELTRGSDNMGIPLAQRMISMLAEPRQEGSLRSLLSIDEPQERFQRALLAMYSGYALADMRIRAEFCPNSLVSTIRVTAVADKPVSSVLIQSDPQAWATSYKVLWDASYTAPDVADFETRENDPPVLYVTTPNYDQDFFEKVKWVVPGSLIATQLGTFRNVLRIKRDETPAAAGFEYRLVECLTTDYVFQPTTFHGGIDRDSGYAIVSAPGGDTNRCQIDVSKSIRFTQPQNFRVEMNLSAFVYTMVLLETLVALALQ